MCMMIAHLTLSLDLPKVTVYEFEEIVLFLIQNIKII